jgi:N-methylhydantoinase A/oxoprolinase/acetone carboxylase beta subunit
MSEIKEYEYTISETPPAMVLIYLKEPLNLQLTAAEEKILNLVKKRPHTLYHIGRQMNRDFDLLPWQGLARIGAVLPASVTPTDILHLTGAYGPWDREAARMGIKILARRYNSGITQFVDAVLEEIYFKIAALITGRLLSGREGGRINFKDQVSRFFLQEMLRPGKGERPVQFSARLGLPLVAVGAPAGAYFPEVAKRLNADLFIPSSAEVANAVGTVSGQTVERASILVRPNGDNGFIIHAPWGRETASDLEDAAAEAMRKGKEYAGAQAAAAGASDIELFVERQDRFANLRRLSDDGEESGLQHKLFVETVIEITAVGRPWS